MLIGLAFLVAVGLLTIGYIHWLDRHYQPTKHYFYNLMFVPPVVGVIGLVIVWLAFLAKWQVGLTFGWTILWSVILPVGAFISLILGGANYLIVEERADD